MACSNKLKLINNDHIHIKPIKKSLTTLQRVVLLANDLVSYNESSLNNNSQPSPTSSSVSFNNKYSVNEDFRNYLIDNSIIFSSPNNIVIHGSHKFTYKVLECYPLNQGTVSNSTTIIVISPDDKILDSLKQEQEQIQQERKEFENSTLSPTTVTTSATTINNKNLRISNFIIHPLYNSINSTTNSANGLFHFIPNSKSLLLNSKKVINIKQLASISNDIDLKQLVSNDYDYLVDCLVTLPTLKQFGLFNGSWIKIKSLNDEDGKEIAIRIFSVSSSNLLKLNDNLVYVPPLSIFNLDIEFKNVLKLSNNQIISNQFEIILLKVSNQNLNDAMESPNSTDIDNNNSSNIDNFPISFPTANRIKISRIKNQISSGYKSYSQQLEKYFNKKRLLKQGDIIIVNNSNYNNSQLINNDKSISNNNNDNIELVYFKVENLLFNQYDITNNNQIYLIDKNKTSIIQEGSSNSMIPSKIGQFYSRYERSEQISIPLDLVYQKEFKQIVDLTLPFLIKSDKFQFDFNCAILLHGPQGVGKKTLLKCVAAHLGIHVFEIDCYEVYDFIETKKDSNIQKVLQDASNNTPTLLILKNFEILEQTTQSMQQEKKESNLSQILINILKEINDKINNNDSNKNNSNNNNSLIIAATVNSLEDLSNKVRNWFKHEILLNAPDENQRFIILNYLLKLLPIDKNISSKNLAIRTASFLQQNLKTLIQRSSINALKRVIEIQNQMNNEITPVEIYNCGFNIILEDITKSLSEMQDFQSSSIGAPKIPNVSWDDVGGLANVKSEIMDTIQLPLEHPHLFASGIGKRSGILLYGPPGTGKTLLAKAIATECSLNFLSVKGPELINMYIGESEKNIRDIFNKARQAKPCVIFFDELDSLAPSRGNGADSGGVMDRVVSQLLAELDGMGKSSDVFIIGATNRPDLLDSSLMRPGRLDRLLYLGISTDKDNQFKICQALTRKFNLSDNVDLRKVVESCPMNLTGADFYALCSDALANAMKDRIQKLTNNQITEDDITTNDQKLIVEQKHFIQAVESLVPSVSLDELEYYHKVQKQFSK